MSWVPHDIRDAVIDFVRYWAEKSGVTMTRFIEWLGIASSKYYEDSFRDAIRFMHLRRIKKKQSDNPLKQSTKQPSA